MSLSRTVVPRILRGAESERARSAVFTVSPPDTDGQPGRKRVHPLARGQATPSVAERIEAARAEGHRQGFEDGYHAGLAELDTSIEAERQGQTARVAEAMSAALRAVVALRAHAVAVAEADVVALAIELAEALLRREVSSSTATSVDALKRALGLVPDGEDLVVRLHPEDVACLGELHALVPDREVRVVADPAVEPGGCLVDVGSCHIDTQIGPSIDRARRLLAELETPTAARVGTEVLACEPAGSCGGQVTAGDETGGEVASEGTDPCGENDPSGHMHSDGASDPAGNALIGSDAAAAVEQTGEVAA